MTAAKLSTKPANVKRRVAAPKKAGPKRKLLARDTSLPPVRTFAPVRARLEALTLLLRRPSLASLMEYYLVRGIEADERELGVLDTSDEDEPTKERARALTALPQFQQLDAAQREKVLAIYRRVDEPFEPGAPALLEHVSGERRGNLVEVDGRHKTVREWSREPGAATLQTIRTRLRAGLPPREAVFAPVVDHLSQNSRARQREPRR